MALSTAQSKSALIITNPQSGNGRGPDLASDAVDHLRAEGWEAEGVVTTCRGDATEIARERAEHFEIVFACGGDGTLNEVVSGIVDRDAIVGVIPAGTANDLARAAGVSLNPAEAIATLDRGHPREIDLLEIDGGEAWSAVAVGAGIDARTVQRAEGLGRPLIGRASYLAAVTAELGEQIDTQLSIEIDGETWEGGALLVQVANCPNHGGRFEIAPGARIDDGRLDVVLIKQTTRARALEMIPLAMAGKHVDQPEVERWSAREVTIEQPEAGPMLIDGEVIEQRALHIRIAPGRLRMWLPDEGEATGSLLPRSRPS